jgi:hypothetical protein
MNHVSVMVAYSGLMCHGDHLGIKRGRTTYSRGSIACAAYIY